MSSDTAQTDIEGQAEAGNVVDFVPPGLNDQPTEQPPPPRIEPTQGEILVGLGFNPAGDPSVSLAKMRGSKVIDVLANLPIRIIEKDEKRFMDANHRMIIEEAIKRQVDATMWAVKALTWTGK